MAKIVINEKIIEFLQVILKHLWHEFSMDV